MEKVWIEAYGSWAVFLGGILEGETVFIAAGYAISQGYLEPLSTFLLAVAGGSVGDLGYYALGRWYGARLIRAVSFLRKLHAPATLLLRRWGRAVAFVMRFAYGLRVILPLSIGAARFPLAVFLPFNLLGSLAFSSVYLLLGYFFGEALEEVLSRARGYEGAVLLGIAVAGAVFWAVREWRLFHAAEGPQQEERETTD
jgi:membrane protein DedA with SNARE-associated domain